MALTAKKAYAASTSYTNEALVGVGALKGAPCTIKSVVKKDGQNIITLGWTGTDGTQQETKVYVDDGTPIYVWESGNTYKYGDLVIYESSFYRCIFENSDLVFDDTKYNEIGSPDGNYDIVEKSTLLPVRFTSADRKMYFSIQDNHFWLWNGTKWVEKLKVDSELSGTSTNALQNKVIKEELEKKEDKFDIIQQIL